MNINIDRSSLLAAIARVRPFTKKVNGARVARLVWSGDSLWLETGALASTRGHSAPWRAYCAVMGDEGLGGPVTVDLDALEAAVGLGAKRDVAFNVSGDGGAAFVDGFRICTHRVVWSFPFGRFTDKPKGIAEFDARELCDTLAMVMPFAGKDVMSYAMTGVSMELKQGDARFTATDGRRLASATTDAVNMTGEFPDAVLPGGVGRFLATRKIADLAGNAVVTMALNGMAANIILDRSLRFGVETYLIDARFPAWRDVIPKDNGNVAKVSASELGGAMKGLKPLLPKGKDGFRAVRLAGVGAALSLAVLRGQGGSEEHPVSFNVPVQSVVGEFDVRLNPDHVADVVKATKGKDLRIAMKDDCAPVLFQPVDDDRFVAVVMPIASA